MFRAEEDCASENKEVHPMLKDILTLMLAIVLSFTTGGSVQDEKMNDSVFQMETIHSFDGRLRVDIDATE